MKGPKWAGGKMGKTRVGDFLGFVWMVLWMV